MLLVSHVLGLALTQRVDQLLRLVFCCFTLGFFTGVLLLSEFVLLADVIAFLKDGEVLEMGTHEQLIAKNGSYADFVRRQMPAN